MSGLRYDRILASTALALVLAAPIGEARSQDASAGAVATVPPRSPKPAASDDALRPSLPAEDRPRPAIRGATGARPSRPKRRLTPTRPGRSHRAGPSRRRQSPAAAAPEATPATTAQPADAAAPVVAADPLASLDPADRADRREGARSARAKTDRIFANKKERAAVEAFYQSRNLAPLWFDKGVENARTKAVVARLKAADADGLDASDYKLPNFANLSDADAQAEAELKLTQVVLTYARHVQAGRFPYTRVSHNNVELPQAPPECRRRARPRSPMRPTPPRRSTNSARRKPRIRSSRRRSPRCAASRSGGHKEIADGPLLKFVSKKPDGRCARADAARASWSRGRPSDLDVRRQARRGGEEIPEGERACRTTATLDAQDRQGAQRAGEEPADRHHPRQHGALALVSARSRQGLFDGQPAGLHAQGGEGRQHALDHPGRHRQPRQGDAAADRDDEVHHRQPDLERAAVDREQRVSAGAAAGSRPCWRAWASR